MRKRVKRKGEMDREGEREEEGRNEERWREVGRGREEEEQKRGEERKGETLDNSSHRKTDRYIQMGNILTNKSNHRGRIGWTEENIEKQ